MLVSSVISKTPGGDIKIGIDVLVYFKSSMYTIFSVDITTLNTIPSESFFPFFLDNSVFSTNLLSFTYG